jgi:hypothetical protein
MLKSEEIPARYTLSPRGDRICLQDGNPGSVATTPLARIYTHLMRVSRSNSAQTRNSGRLALSSVDSPDREVRSVSGPRFGEIRCPLQLGPPWKC